MDGGPPVAGLECPVRTGGFVIVVALLACKQPADTVDTDVPADVTFTAVGFNVESGGSDTQIVADQVVAAVQGESLWGFEEVQNQTAATILMAAVNDAGSDQDFQYVYGTTGWEDRLVLAWDNTRFELVSSEELNDINIGGTARAPLVGHMRERSTGTAFLFVVNHLWRTDNDARHEQGTMLNAWGAQQIDPIVMVGDYNFDWKVDGTGHDIGYDNLTANGVFVWVQPDPIVMTECNAGYNSLLDFTFLGGGAKSWPATSEILNRDDDYCSHRNQDINSDHRPVKTQLTIPR